MTKSYVLQGLLFLFLLTVLTGCELVAGIFKAGVWVGVIMVVAIVILVIWLLRRMSR